MIGWINRTRAQVKGRAEAPQALTALGHILHELRLFKSRAELRLMGKAADISVAAHQRILEACKPGGSEFEIEAEILHVFGKHRSVPAYEPIVGSGKNACVLHYRANSAELVDGDLLLVDAGAEFEGYAADITRTVPVNGAFSKPQRAIYEVVLAAQRAAIAEVKPGNHWEKPHQAAVRTISEGLIKLGLLKGDLAKVIKDGEYQRFFMHKTGHWLGLDVHDVGDYRVGGQPRVFEPGMVLTVEPGIYIGADEKSVSKRWRGIGVRIEDDVVVTKDGNRVLTESAPKDPDEIERIMAAARDKAKATPVKAARRSRAMVAG